VELQGGNVDRRARTCDADVLGTDDIGRGVALVGTGRGEVPLRSDGSTSRRVNEVVVAEERGLADLRRGGRVGPGSVRLVRDGVERRGRVRARQVEKVSDGTRGAKMAVSKLSMSFP
jgi:hypothetical protein